MTAPAALWRNRDFTLLWTSQTLSELGSSLSDLAMPLLVLVLTESPVQAGLIGSLAATVRFVFRMPAGVIADRVDRRRMMIICDGVRLVAFTGFAIVVLQGQASLTLIAAVTVVNSAADVMFGIAERSALPTLVSRSQLSTAVASNEARAHGVALAGPPLGGLLFSVSRALPFAGNAASFALSLIGVLLIRGPLQKIDRATPTTSHTADLREGIRFTFQQPFLRAIMFIAVPLNLAFNGVFFAMIVMLQHGGTSPALIGTVESIFAVGGLLGALAAPWLQRVVSMATLTVSICWTSAMLIALSAAFSGSVLAAIPLAAAIFISPACNAALFGYQAALTPDRLQGRVMSVIFTVTTSGAIAAPVLAGVLFDAFGGTATVLAFAGCVTVAAIGATNSRSIRRLRPLKAPAIAAPATPPNPAPTGAA